MAVALIPVVRDVCASCPVKPGEIRQTPTPPQQSRRAGTLLGAWLGLFAATEEALRHLINSTPYVNTSNTGFQRQKQVLPRTPCGCHHTQGRHCGDRPRAPVCPPRRSHLFCHHVVQGLLLSRSPHPLLHPMESPLAYSALTSSLLHSGGEGGGLFFISSSGLPSSQGPNL